MVHEPVVWVVMKKEETTRKNGTGVAKGKRQTLGEATTFGGPGAVNDSNLRPGRVHIIGVASRRGRGQGGCVGVAKHLPPMSISLTTS